MAVCKYFLQGKCNFGDRCRNEHPQNQPSGFGQSSSQSFMKAGGLTPNNNNRFGVLSGGFGKQTAAFGGFVNRQGAPGESAAAGEKAKYVAMDGETLTKGISDRPLWKLSVFGPKYNKPNVLSGTDVSPEEMHLDFVNAARTNELPGCEAKYRRLEQEVEARIAEIKRNSVEYARQWEAQYGDQGAGAGASVFGNKPAFGAFASAAAGASGFGQQNVGNAAFGTPNKPLAFGGGSAVSAFGTPSKPSAFGGGNAVSAFGTQSKVSGFGFGNSNAGAAFGTPSKPGAFGTGGTGGFGSGFGAAGSAFGAAAGNGAFGGQSKDTTPKFSAAETRPLRNLLEEEIAMYKAARFVYGKVPEQAPTVDLV